jgi:hypothetical protein
VVIVTGIDYPRTQMERDGAVLAKALRKDEAQGRRGRDAEFRLAQAE